MTVFEQLFKQLVNHFGGYDSEMARQLGVPRQNVYNWKMRGEIPELAARRIADASEGAFVWDEKKQRLVKA